MKLKFYSISLLLSFLIVLSHEMIPHHHHDFTMDKISSLHKYADPHFHHLDSDHHYSDAVHKHKHSDNENKEHKHNFPIHFHIITAKKISSARLALNDNLVTGKNTLAVLYFFNSSSKQKEPPIKDLIRFTGIPFRINIIFEPGSTGLRAPPTIA